MRDDLIEGGGVEPPWPPAKGVVADDFGGEGFVEGEFLLGRGGSGGFAVNSACGGDDSAHLVQRCIEILIVLILP